MLLCEHELEVIVSEPRNVRLDAALQLVAVLRAQMNLCVCNMFFNHRLKVIPRKRKINEIRKICRIYYENIDAILIDENDYNKLVGLGYVGDKLGMFKIEHIFTEIAISSGRKFVATLEDGSKLIHCPKKDIDYDEFVNEVKNNNFTTYY